MRAPHFPLERPHTTGRGPDTISNARRETDRVGEPSCGGVGVLMCCVYASGRVMPPGGRHRSPTHRSGVPAPPRAPRG
eukprot:3515306-Prymnesium_polylepis.1